MNRIPVLLFLLLFLLMSVEAAKACEPYPEYWFTETIAFSNITLPDNITIRATDPELSPRASIWVINQTEGTVFVLPVDLLKQPTVADSKELIPNASSKAYKSITNQNDPLQLDMSDLLLLDSDLKDPNPINMGRPAENEIQLPSPVHSQLNLLYLDQVITIPFTVTYSINPHNSVADCNRWYERVKITESAIASENKANSGVHSYGLAQYTLPSLFIVGIIILGASAILLFRRKR